MALENPELKLSAGEAIPLLVLHHIMEFVSEVSSATSGSTSRSCSTTLSDTPSITAITSKRSHSTTSVGIASSRRVKSLNHRLRASSLALISIASAERSVWANAKSAAVIPATNSTTRRITIPAVAPIDASPLLEMTRASIMPPTKTSRAITEMATMSFEVRLFPSTSSPRALTCSLTTSFHSSTAFS